MFIECKEDEQEEIVKFDKPFSRQKCVRFASREDQNVHQQLKDSDANI